MKRDLLAKAFIRAYRIEAYTRQGGRCIYCGAFLTAKTVTAEHIISVGCGGTDRADNIAAACRLCNNTKSNLSLADFLKMLKTPGPDARLPLLLCHFNRRLNIAVQRAEDFVERASIRGLGL